VNLSYQFDYRNRNLNIGASLRCYYGVRVPPFNILSNAPSLLFTLEKRSCKFKVVVILMIVGKRDAWNAFNPADRIIQFVKPRNKVPVC